MAGSVTYEMTAQDNVDAVNTHTGKVASKLAWVFLLLAAINFGLDWWIGIPIQSDIAGWGCIAAWLIFLIWDWLARDWTIRRQFQQSLKMRTPIRLSWDDQAITFDTDHSHSVYPWKDFFRWMGSGTSLLLYRDASFFFPIPRRALSEGDYEEMVQALRAGNVRCKGRRHSAQSRPISS